MAETASPLTGEALPEDIVLPDDSERTDASSADGEDSTDEPGIVVEQLVMPEVPQMPPDLVEIFWDNRFYMTWRPLKISSPMHSKQPPGATDHMNQPRYPSTLEKRSSTEL